MCVRQHLVRDLAKQQKNETEREAGHASPHRRRVSRHGNVRDAPGSVEHRQGGRYSSSSTPAAGVRSAPHAHPIVEQRLRTLRDVDDLKDSSKPPKASVARSETEKSAATRRSLRRFCRRGRPCDTRGQRGHLSLPFRREDHSNKQANKQTPV